MLTTNHASERPRTFDTCVETRWTLHKDGRQISCQLHVHAPYSIGVHVLRDGQVSTGVQFDSCVAAITHADALLADLRAHGWQ
jgi:hypothetical protein